MSYQVLARKWRPRRFVEMVGQEHVLRALVNALDEDRLHHAYLFTGTRGVGKTSIARLFAKSLNCEQGVSSEPCGQCSACVEIAEGRFVDLIEVDAASRTKVEDTRELLENVQYAPTQGRYKVYLIDEVHMLSGHSFNALLKTLEEPPPHIKFLLATTDPQKLPVTILSRCLQFNLKNLMPERIVEHLSYVLGEESIQFDDAALWLLARSAEGSMRDALSLTDQSIAFGAGAVNEADVRAMLGTIDHRIVFELLEALVSQNGKEMMDQVQRMSEFTPDYSGVLAELISILHRIALAQVVPDAIDNALGDQQQVQSLASRMRAEEVQLYYQIALNGRKDLPMVPQPREGLEMTLLRMLAFRPVDQRPVDKPVAQTQTPAVSPKPEMTEASSIPRPEPVAPRSEPVVMQVPSPAVQPEPVAHQAPPVMRQDSPAQTVRRSPDIQSIPQSDIPPWEEVPPEYAAERDDVKKSDRGSEQSPFVETETPVDSRPEVTAEDGVNETPKVAATPVDSIPSDLMSLKLDHWVVLVSSLGLSGMTESLARSLSLEQLSGNRLVFNYTSEQEALLNETHRSRISDAVNAYFNEPVDVEFQLGQQTRETPADYRLRRDRERKAAALKYLKQDPVVLQLIETFGAEIDESSVEALDIE